MLTVGPTFSLMDEFAETYDRLVGGSAVEAFKMTRVAPTPARSSNATFIASRPSPWPPPEVAHGLESGAIATIEELRATRGGEELAGAIGPFLEAHGDLGHAGEDMRALAWVDDLSLLFAELGRRLANAAPDPDERQARLIAEGEAIAERAREKLRDRPADLAAFEEVLARRARRRDR
jgi:hypothetical protein